MFFKSMDDDVKIKEAAECQAAPAQALEEAAAVTDEEAAAGDGAATATERGTAPCDTMGPGDDGNQPEQQDVARGGKSGDEPGDGQDIEALVAAAERRGYLRGRNERIEALMAKPGVWEERTSSPTILNRPRRSIWD